MDYYYLNTTTLGIVSMAFLLSFWLPMPQRSLFFKGKKAASMGSQSQQEGPGGLQEQAMYEDEDGPGTEKMDHSSMGSASWCSRENVAAAGHLLWQSFRESYSSRHLLFWILSIHTLITEHTFYTLSCLHQQMMEGKRVFLSGTVKVQLKSKS